MFTTGTDPCSASSSRVSCGPVRTQIACTKRDSTSAVSRTDSPRESCISLSRSTSGVPPSSATPTSKEIRVRVDGRSKISATLRPSSARETSRSALSSAARSSIDRSSSLVTSSPVRKWRVTPGS